MTDIVAELDLWLAQQGNARLYSPSVDLCHRARDEIMALRSSVKTLETAAIRALKDGNS